MTATIDSTLDFIAGHADERQIDVIHAALRDRRKALAARRALAVTVGQTVTLDGLSPKYLNGLTGTVRTIKGNRADVLLDEASTLSLRWAGRRFVVPEDTKNYLLTGVPTTCCHVQD